jgi:hypothetical protein
MYSRWSWSDKTNEFCNPDKLEFWLHWRFRSCINGLLLLSNPRHDSVVKAKHDQFTIVKIRFCYSTRQGDYSLNGDLAQKDSRWCQFYLGRDQSLVWSY